VVGGAVDAGMRGAQVRSAGGAMTPEVGGVKDESGRASDASSDSWVPSSRGVTGNAVIQGVEVGSTGRAVA
jgi:hypothetical protein